MKSIVQGMTIKHHSSKDHWMKEERYNNGEAFDRDMNDDDAYFDEYENYADVEEFEKIPKRQPRFR